MIASLLVFLVGAVFYLSWLPNPRLEGETYLPLWLRNWSNTSFNARTAIPFVFLGFLLQAWQGIIVPTPGKKKALRLLAFNTFIAAMVVCLAEGGQFFILDRHPDFMDVGYGILGSLVGSVLYYLFNILVHIIFIKNEKQT